MRIGVLSDLHGNRDALAALLPRLKGEACDLYLCLGDLCGYYYDVEPVVGMLQQLDPLRIVRGNHDEMAARALANPLLCGTYTSRYGDGLQAFLSALTPAVRALITTLPLSFSLPELNLHAVHASPGDPLRCYVYPDSPLGDFAWGPSPALWFLGHTHRPMWRQTDGLTVCNPGSVGQPRDGGWPSYGIWDQASQTFRVERVPYDVAGFISRLRREHPALHPFQLQPLERILGVEEK